MGEQGQTELLPCPFCGEAPEISTRTDEDLWSHNQVKWTAVNCVECGVGFSWPAGAEPDAIEQWNTRAASPREAALVEALTDLCEAWDNSCLYSERKDKFKGNVTAAHKAALAALAQSQERTSV